MTAMSAVSASLSGCGGGDGAEGTADDACRYWAVYNIPASTTSFSAGQEISKVEGTTEGGNYEGGIGYAGPCPPRPRAYRLTIYTPSDDMPDIPGGTALTRSRFESSYGEYILESAMLTGLFPPER